jgi:hypothetical protein
MQNYATATRGPRRAIIDFTVNAHAQPAGSLVDSDVPARPPPTNFACWSSIRPS